MEKVEEQLFIEHAALLSCPVGHPMVENTLPDCGVYQTDTNDRGSVRVSGQETYNARSRYG